MRRIASASCAFLIFLGMAYGFYSNDLKRPAPRSYIVAQRELVVADSDIRHTNSSECGAPTCSFDFNKSNTGNQGNNKDDQASNKGPDILGTITLFVLAFQAWIYHKQRVVMQRQADIAERQRILMRRQSLSMKRQTTIMRDGLNSARESANAAMLAASAATDQVKALKAAERPHLVVKNIRMDLTFSTAETVYPGMGVPRSVPIQFDTANVGKSPARVIKYGYCGFIGKELPPIPEWTEEGTWFEPIIPTDEIGAMGYVLEGKEPVFLNISRWLELKKPQEGGDRIFFYGFVEYIDIHDDKHTTSGAWTLVHYPYADPEEFFQPCGPAAYWKHT